MRLPEIAGSGKQTRQLVSFGGIDRRVGAAAGTLEDSYNLSSARYPALYQRGGASAYGSYTAATSIFSWDGKLVVTDGDKLYYDGTQVGTVSIGAKQFAVVNSKLVVWPDKVYIDLTDGKCKSLDGSIVFAGANIAKDSIRGTVSIGYSISQELKHPVNIVYGTGIAALYVKQSDGTFAWEHVPSASSLLGNYDGVTKLWLAKEVAVTGTADTGYAFYWAYDFASTGSIQVMSGARNEAVTAKISRLWAKSETDDNILVAAEVYDGSQASVGATFAAGDGVEVSGCIAKYNNRSLTVEKVLTDGLTFGADQLVPLVYYLNITAKAEVGTSVGFYNGDRDSTSNIVRVTFPDGSVLEPGDQIYFSTWPTDTPAECYWYHEETKTLEALTAGVPTSGASSSYTLTAYSKGSESVTVQRKVPDMDYICERDNRLWGVSNAVENKVYNQETGEYDAVMSRCVYASALGNPTNFNLFKGLSTDSYALAIGSDGDFTGICAYGGGTLCWKEQGMHKIVGNMPSEYQLYSYAVEGVQEGSGKSLVNINETLFYKGANGVYAYSGGSPALISGAFGTERFSGGTAGTDGENYYISMADGSGQYGLWVYDTANGLWLRRDGDRRYGFALLGGKLHILSGTGVHIEDQAAFDGVWYAVFNPINETVLERKGYNRLYFRLRMEEGSWARVDRKKGDTWEQLWISPDRCRRVVDIPVLPVLGDDLQIKISGKGRCLIESMVREFDVEG